MHRPDTTGPATAPAVNRPLDVGFGRLDIPAITTATPAAQHDFGPLLPGVEFAAHVLRTRYRVAPDPAETIASLAGMGARAMSAPLTSTTAVQLAPDALTVFRARAEARAALYAAGEYDLHTAVDVLQHDAERLGLVAEYGQDEIQRLMAAAFRPVRAGEVSA